jgi:hypothetical protein
MGPNSLRHVEQSMAAVASAPLDQPGKVALCGVIDDFVFGYVVRNIEGPPLDIRALDQQLQAHLASGHFPYLKSLIGDDAPSALFERAGAWMRAESRFEFGLQALLDAVEAGHTPVKAAGTGVSAGASAGARTRAGRGRR